MRSSPASYRSYRAARALAPFLEFVRSPRRPQALRKERIRVLVAADLAKSDASDTLVASLRACVLPGRQQEGRGAP